MSKCNIVRISDKEKDLNTCEFISNYLNHDKSAFQKVMIVNVGNGDVSHVIKAGKKGGYVYLNYCPFCGEKIGDFYHEMDD